MNITTPCSYENRFKIHGAYICQPSDPEACEPCQKQFELGRKIMEMREAIVAMERQQSELETQVNAHHDTLTRRLPLEVIAEIFKLCIHSSDIINTDFQMTQDRFSLTAPLILSSVSQRWRNIAFSTPALWDHVPLHVTPANMKSLPYLVKDWIDRSGQCPLSIFVQTNHEGARNLIEVLNQYSSRWRLLYFIGPSDHLSLFSSDMEGTAKLETLILSSTAPGTNTTFDLKNLLVRPKVLITKHLRLKDVKIKLNHLSYLNVYDGLDVSECLEVLRCAPRLQKCKMRPEIHQNSVPLPSKPIVHGMLLDITLIGSRGLQILQRLRCPSLTKLILERVMTLGWMTDVVEFVQHSDCRIKYLFFSWIVLEKGDINILCNHIPNTLQHLHLTLSRPFPVFLFFDRLTIMSVTPENIQPLYFPLLEELVIDQERLLDCASLLTLYRTRTNLKCLILGKGVSIRWHRYTRPNTVTIVAKDDATLESTRTHFLALEQEGVRLDLNVGKIAEGRKF
ncbi:hypothetical protein BDN70DRAFT_917417 [Pholiota conissans]|uniref:F-box domain-containing protein n=1 Tax=Pholiota conissans TaxID=109636 RepID=A0A9P5ZCA7_9AGAR|nr:hypothetical protein BDN70DRAFT_917417 [Pholiota conissans]